MIGVHSLDPITTLLLDWMTESCDGLLVKVEIGEMAKYGVIDWSGVWLFDQMQFDSFEDGWSFIYAFVERQCLSQNEADDFYDGVYVMPLFEGKPVGWFDPWPDVDLDGVQLELDIVWHERVRESRTGMMR